MNHSFYCTYSGALHSVEVWAKDPDEAMSVYAYYVIKDAAGRPSDYHATVTMVRDAKGYPPLSSTYEIGITRRHGKISASWKKTVAIKGDGP